MSQAIAIIGTGLSGLTAALSTAQRHIPVTLIGPEPHAQSDDRTTAILAPGIAFLKKLSVWDKCVAHAIPLMTMELIDGDDRFVYDASETELNEFGFNVPNHVLRQSLLHAIARNKNVTWIKETVETAKGRGRTWELTLANKKKIAADLIVAADGRKGLMRDAAHIDILERDENQTALVAVLEASKAHHYTSVEWYRAGGPLTLVPMEGKKLALVWCEDDDTANTLKNKSLDALSKELTAITAERFGSLRFLSKPQAWKIRPVKAQHLVRDNVVLIGEAAHVLPPIGAQGFNTSLHDIAALQDMFDRAQRLGLPLTDGALLKRFENARLRDMAMRYHGMTRLNDLIRTAHPALKIARAFGLRTLHRFPSLKKRVMQFGLGHSFTGTSSKDHAA